MGSEQTRQRFADTAHQAVGLGYGGDTRRLYLELIAPNLSKDEPIDDLGRSWNGALVTLGVWRRAGVRHRLLELGRPWASLQWVGDIGASLNAERYPDGTRVPELGDAVELDGGERLIAAIVHKRGAFVDAAEGWVDRAGNRAVIATRDKKVGYIAGTLYVGSSRVLRWYDCTALAPGAKEGSDHG
jgi:hypothetical protein